MFCHLRGRFSVFLLLPLSSSVSFSLECLGEAGGGMSSIHLVPKDGGGQTRRVCLSRTQLSPNRESELIYSESNRDDHGQRDRKKARRAGCLESWGRCTQPWKEGEIMRSEMRREDG